MFIHSNLDHECKKMPFFHNIAQLLFYPYPINESCVFHGYPKKMEARTFTVYFWTHFIDGVLLLILYDAHRIKDKFMNMPKRKCN